MTLRDENGPITVGAIRAQAVIVAVHEQEDHDGKVSGVALGYREHTREWWVWRVMTDGSLEYGRYTSDGDRARFLYAERVAERLFTYFNAAAPALTFERVNEFRR